MDITPQDESATKAISDDQELAQALAGVVDQPEEQKMQFEETATPPTTNGAQAVQAADPAAAPTKDKPADTPADTVAIPELPPLPETDESTATSSTPSVDAPSSDLDGIKSKALDQLRPLIDHVDLPAEEKFDTYLLLIRSTDDTSLIGPAHEAAQNIADEKRKAEALLDIIKEIDYLSRKDK